MREFNGSSDRIVVDNGIIGQLGNAAHTILVVARPTTLNAGEAYVAAENGANGASILFDNAGGGGDLAIGDDNEYVPASVGETAAQWQILAVTWSGPGTTPRFHRKQLGAGSWTHQNAGGAFTGNTVSTAQISFGCFNNGAFSSFKDMRLAVSAIFTSVLSDAQIESTQTTPSTATLRNLGPVSLWDFNQGSVATPVTDLRGNGADQTIISGTTVVNGDDPPGWTFGLGTSDALVPRHGVGFGRW